MRNFRKLLASLIAIFCLAGCTVSGSGNGSKASSSESSSAPSTSITSSSEGSSSESSSSGSSSSSEPSTPEVVAKTVEDVVADINGVFNPLIGSDILAWYEAYGCYIGGLNLGAAEHAADDQHAAELQAATEFVVSYLPEYLTVDAAGFEEEYDDYYIGLSVDEVGVDNFGYVDEGNIIVQIQVSSIAE